MSDSRISIFFTVVEERVHKHPTSDRLGVELRGLVDFKGAFLSGFS